MNDTVSSVHDATAALLSEEAQKVRECIASSRSDTLLRLFDLLLQATIDGKCPTETDIAEGIFQPGPASMERSRSRVRVAVHRLRKKLDAYYADKTRPRLFIPQGQYGFMMDSPNLAEPDVSADTNRIFSWSRIGQPILVAVLLLVGANVGLAWLYFGAGSSAMQRDIAQPALWGPFFAAKKPTVVAVGDYFMFIRHSSDGRKEEPTQDMDIRTVEEFFDYATNNSNIPVASRDANMTSVSSNILPAVAKISTYIGPINSASALSSGLTPAVLKSSNIVYIGALDTLTPLIGIPLRQASKFSCEGGCYALKDEPSGRRFVSDSSYLLPDWTVPRRDYGYIASLPGPFENQILVVSGTGDAGVAQMASVVTNPKSLEELRRALGGNFGSFEALYQVRKMFDQDYTSTLVLARPIDTRRSWDKTKTGDWRQIAEALPLRSDKSQ